jgi:hypothetical protein
MPKAKKHVRGGAGGAATRKAPAALAPPSLAPKTIWPKNIEVVAQEAAENQLLWVQAALSPEECLGWVEFAEGLGMVSTRPQGGRAERGNAYRDNFRVQINDAEVAQSLWASGLGAAISAVLPPHVDGRTAAGFNDNIRLYRYDPGLRFGKHYDQMATDSLGRDTFYTVLFYLVRFF